MRCRRQPRLPPFSLIPPSAPEDKWSATWKANSKLSVSLEEIKSKPNHYLPVRIMRPQQPYLQEPISPLDADGSPLSFSVSSAHRVVAGQPRTLASVLQAALPALFAGAAAFPNPQYSVLIHGITPPPETPVLWLVETFAHPDNFLYITVQPNNG